MDNVKDNKVIDVDMNAYASNMGRLKITSAFDKFDLVEKILYLELQQLILNILQRTDKKIAQEVLLCLILK